MTVTHRAATPMPRPATIDMEIDPGTITRQRNTDPATADQENPSSNRAGGFMRSRNSWSSSSIFTPELPLPESAVPLQRHRPLPQGPRTAIELLRDNALAHSPRASARK